MFWLTLISFNVCAILGFVVLIPSIVMLFPGLYELVFEGRGTYLLYALSGIAFWTVTYIAYLYFNDKYEQKLQVINKPSPASDLS